MSEASIHFAVHPGGKLAVSLKFDGAAPPPGIKFDELSQAQQAAAATYYSIVERGMSAGAIDRVENGSQSELFA